MTQKSKNIPKLRFPEFVNEGEWEDNTLINISKFRRGSFPQPYGLPEWYDEINGMPFIQVFDVGEDFRLKPTTKSRISKLAAEQSVFIQKETLIITIQGSIGRVAITQYDAYIDRTLLLFEELYNDIDKTFFAYVLFILFEIEKLKAPGGIIKTITKEVLSGFEIKIPKNPIEQQKIASCLSSLDELIAAHSQKLEVLKEHKKGLMQNLFPQEGEKVPKYRFKEFKGEWKEKTLGAVAKNVMYGMNASAVEFDGENKYIRITDINENSRLFLPNPLTSPDGQLEEKYLINVGDLLFARTGASVGKSYLHQNECGKIYFAGFLIRFTIKNAIPYFVYAQTLTEHYQKWVSKTSMRSGQPGINAEEYKSYPIFLPTTIEEQQKIASCLSALDELITAQVEKIKQLKQHKKGLMQGLFPKMNE